MISKRRIVIGSGLVILAAIVAGLSSYAPALTFWPRFIVDILGGAAIGVAVLTLACLVYDDLPEEWRVKWELRAAPGKTALMPYLFFGIVGLPAIICLMPFLPLPSLLLAKAAFISLWLYGLCDDYRPAKQSVLAMLQYIGIK